MAARSVPRRHHEENHSMLLLCRIATDLLLPSRLLALSAAICRIEDIATAVSWEIHVDCFRDHLYNFFFKKA